MNSHCISLDNGEGVGVSRQKCRHAWESNHCRCKTTKAGYGSTKCSQVKLYDGRNLTLASPAHPKGRLTRDTWNNLLDLWTQMLSDHMEALGAFIGLSWLRSVFNLFFVISFSNVSVCKRRNLDGDLSDYPKSQRLTHHTHTHTDVANAYNQQALSSFTSCSSLKKFSFWKLKSFDAQTKRKHISEELCLHPIFIIWVCVCWSDATPKEGHLLFPPRERRDWSSGSGRPIKGPGTQCFPCWTICPLEIHRFICEMNLSWISATISECE